MSRSVPEWRGKNDDSAIPPRVKLRVYQKAEGKCAKCGIDAWAGEFDHAIPIILGGENRENNLQLLCVPCHRAKTKLDVKLKAKVARVRKRHIGIKTRKGRPIPGSKDSGWKKPFNGPAIRREVQR